MFISIDTNFMKNETPVFIIKHFAADVIYNVDSFLAMNKDTVSEHLITVMKKSKFNLIREVLDVENNEKLLKDGNNFLTSNVKNSI
ncbi:Unconventional myosin-Va [Dirofilaria immitis]